MNRGRLVAFEGGEGCGKSTQARLLAEHLGAVLTHEPGGTALGARLRDLLLEPVHGPVGPRTEALLMAADRAQHVSELIRPALGRGDDVVTDRFVGSSLAYQGYGRGLPLDAVRALSAWATDGVTADLVVLLDVPAGVAASRAGAPGDRFEVAGEDFHGRVLAGFADLSAADPERWEVLDGTGTVEDVAAAVREVVARRLGHASPAGGTGR
ncbi:dTMP kinase [soil metagenome]